MSTARKAPPVVLAFSGGLDTSFCVPYLKEKGHEVTTLFVDTGGVDAEEREYIETRAHELGAKEHITVDGSAEVWDRIVVPMVRGGELYQGQYPLLVSDRYVIVQKSLEAAKARGITHFAHGCTGMGNDQVRFDLTVRALGDFEILAPIRDIQSEHKAVRAYEQEYLLERGFTVRLKTSKYSINENLLGVTMSGSEIDEWQAPGPETYRLTAHATRWPTEKLVTRLAFEKGVLVSIDGEGSAGPRMLAKLNRRFGAYGVGRSLYTGDTSIGLKGRIVFEAPGLLTLMAAHRALEEAVLTSHQNTFKREVGQKWVELVYKGFFYEPLKRDLEQFLASSQEFVHGTVTVETQGGAVTCVAIESPHILRAKGAVYAQSADWGAREAEGFIKLLGQSTTLSAKINPVAR
jgi:argininosuccinate synthase